MNPAQSWQWDVCRMELGFDKCLKISEASSLARQTSEKILGRCEAESHGNTGRSAWDFAMGFSPRDRGCVEMCAPTLESILYFRVCPVNVF